jgi:TPR repeat protein
MRDANRLLGFVRLLLFAAVFSVSAVRAGDLEDARAAYEGGAYAVAMQLFRPLAEQQNADAQYYLGLMYDAGKGVQRDSLKAFEWYFKAATAGNAEAQVSLGGILDRDGSEKQAVYWYRRAADQGNELGQFILGVKYEEGEGVPQDYIQAHMWFNLAASDDTTHKGAVARRDEVAAKMTPDQIAEAQRMAREWRPK